MTILRPYIVEQLDYFGVPYISTVFLSDTEARDRIVDGRLLTVAEGKARNIERLWALFKDRVQQPGGSYNKEWVEREEIKELIENGSI